MITRYPLATYRELPQAKTEPFLTPISVVWHTAVSWQSSLYGFFNSPAANGVESHLYLRIDGTWEQYMPFNRQADCQRDGNKYAISIESQDNGASDPDDITPWSTAQLESSSRFLVWAHENLHIPLRVCPAYNASGIGYHALFTGDPGWNKSHACPARRRIAQFPTILERAIELVGNKKLGRYAMALGPAIVVENQSHPEKGLFAVTFDGLVHIKNPTHKDYLISQGWIREDTKSISDWAFNQLNEKES